MKEQIKLKRTYVDFIQAFRELNTTIWFPKVKDAESLKWLIEQKEKYSINQLITLSEHKLRSAELGNYTTGCVDRELVQPLTRSLEIITGVILENEKDLQTFLEGLALSGDFYDNNGRKKVYTEYKNKPYLAVIRLLEIVNIYHDAGAPTPRKAE